MAGEVGIGRNRVSLEIRRGAAKSVRRITDGSS